MIFNVILLHIGETFDDRKESFKEEHPVLFKCFESVKKEFKDGNIIVFYSYEEIFEKFPNLKNIIDKKYSKFFYDKNIQENYKTDLIRILLTQYYENMLYLDADVYIDKGFKAKLLKIVKKEKAIFFVIYKGLCSFYSRKYFEKINVFLKLFEGDYKGDENGMQRCNFKDLEEVSFKYRFNYFSLHHPNCSYLRGKYKNIYLLPENITIDQIYNIERRIQDLKECGAFVQYKNNIIIFKAIDGNVHISDIGDKISIDDYLRELNFPDLPKIKLNNF